MRNNLRSRASIIIIPEAEEPLLYSNDNNCEHLVEDLTTVEKQNGHLVEDLTVVGHKFNDSPDGPCFCHSPSLKNSSSATEKTTFKFPSHHIPLMPMNTDHCTRTSDTENQCDQNEENNVDGEKDADSDTDDENEDDDDTYSCSSASSRSSRDPRCPRCFIIANTDCSKAVYV